MNGGAIVSNGKLTVWGGNVTFDGNHAEADPLSLRSYSSGGGAIWATGELHVKNDTEGKPKFINNQALVQELTDGKLGKGGAGGAIFFDKGEAYIIGGDYQNNKSGYLGGAIYTEDGSTTYVGKAVAFENTAGHFGGGLWFCPSGNSAASKGGNIALFDNHTKPDIDGNPDNGQSKIPTDSGANTTQAGSDLAIMNPYWKWANGWLGVSSNQFLLLDTWFTDRSKAAVTWQWDNVPLRESSGYHDSWIPTANLKRQGIRAVLATEDTTGALDVSHIPTTGKLLQLQAKTDVDDDATHTWIRTGVGLKAKVVNDDAKNGARNGARVTMTKNQARLSGGAFGSDGVVIFDTPYSMEWSKTSVTVDGKPDTDKPLAGSTWTLTYDGDTPYNDPDMRPADCPAVSDGEVSEDCWHKVTDGTTEKWSVDIVDNGKRDNNPLAGGLGVENLALGTYELTEKTPPAGYHSTRNVYTFTIEKGADGQLPPTPTLTLKTGTTNDDFGPLDSTANAIGNKPIEGHLAWTKNAEGKRLHDTTWTITHKVNNKDVNVTVSDCVSTTCDANIYDTDPAVGEFDIPIADTNAWPDGSYTLHEETAPAGYWKVADRTFTIATVNQDRTVTWNDGKGGDMTDEVMGVAWSKIDAADHGLLAGSQWTITKTGAAGAQTETWTVSDCETEGCTTPENEAADQDTVAGEFKVTGLTSGTYELKEAKAPAGYELSTTTYTFTIEEGQHTITDVRISIKNKQNSVLDEGNPVPNSKTPVSALPFTGGRSGLDWLVVGGGLALAATTAGLVTGRARRREEL
ncbi:hypothetical protein CSQ85_09220 [Bifidobacterium rousetti]|uniref:prealbumin-like fold domain-containing protein n=1 Tax=Bifidobacterium rousetti TaxID=2045439 RepID=UPI001239709F|nr:prealbumin-like fold domain-containing protein [Bifidobacterium rousetti]KAA8818331.1 hypothetical protein CSQ85_09220 [Bifidobacterium rousetti]